MEEERKFKISTAKKRTETEWAQKEVTWQKFAEKCSKTEKTDETMAKFAAMDKEQQGKIKDVGGFVAGSLKDKQRKKGNVLCRSMVTLDLDHVTTSAEDLWETIKKKIPYTSLVYSTHKHTKENPRLRLIVPMSQDLKPEEYEPVARKLADKIGIEQFDRTTFQPERLMYWPSTSQDAEFFYQSNDAKLCNPDDILDEYTNWKNYKSWPICGAEDEVFIRQAKEIGDPRNKSDEVRIIGAFCRAYSIDEAIDKFLSEVYKPGENGRYTFIKGTSANGVVCYPMAGETEPRIFAYSHHETDPARGQLLNAFDLVRIHLFGNKDARSHARNPTSFPSFGSMQELALKDDKVRTQLVQVAFTDFDNIEFSDTEEDNNNAWMKDLLFKQNGAIKMSIGNFYLILKNDPCLKDHFYLDDLSGYIKAFDLPWAKGERFWEDSDDAGLHMYLEDRYELNWRIGLNDAFSLVAKENHRHPIKEYLDALSWDGVKRLENVIIRFFGAQDNGLNKAMTRKHFVAAVARIYEPGIKYDNCLILAGGQGAGKSIFFRTMAVNDYWFDDSIPTIEGREGREGLQGKWIIEFGELTGVKKSEVEAVKKYLSTQIDSYRRAYDKRVGQYPRQCIFCGSTNEAYFLKDDTGNRRFWVIGVDDEYCKAHPVAERVEVLKKDLNQIWAEAVVLYKQHEPLYLTEEEESQLNGQQKEYDENEIDPIPALLDEFLDKKLPADWPTKSIAERRNWLSSNDPLNAEGVEVRMVFCIAEFLCEKLVVEFSSKEYKALSRKVGNLMKKKANWKGPVSSRHAQSLYGIQRSYKRIEVKPDEDDDI